MASYRAMNQDADTRAEVTRQGGPARFTIPTTWLKQGRRIARESMAATGSGSMQDVLDHLGGAR